MVMVWTPTSAFAQTTIDPTGRSGEPPGLLKKEFQRTTPPPSPVLPLVPLPPETGVSPQPGTVRVFVQFVHVIGNTVFSDAEIAEVTAPFQNRTLLTEDLERLRLALTLLYVNKGYLTSGAIIPDLRFKPNSSQRSMTRSLSRPTHAPPNSPYQSGFARSR
jgi:hemolysin activation/secretion protein